jgi:hypothetical protein
MSARRALAALGLTIVFLSVASPAWAQTAPTTPPPTVPAAPADPLVTTTTAPAPLEESDDGRGFFDIAGRMNDAINGWFTDLVNGAADPVFELIGDRVLSTPDFTTDARVRELWFLSWGVANGVFVLLIVAAGALGMAHESLQSRYAMKELLPRLLVAWIAANASLVVARVAIGFANSVTDVFVGQGIGFEGGASVLKLSVTSAVAGGPPFLTLVALVTVVLGLCVACVGIARAFTVLALVAAAPLFLIGHALPHTDGAARLWWRSLIGCLSVQVGQAVLLATAVRVFFAAPAEGGIANLPHNAFMDLLVVTCLLWLMLRIPSYARRLVFNTRPNAIGNAVRYQVVGRATRAAGKAATAAMAAA